jgi:hypothetical protein
MKKILYFFGFLALTCACTGVPDFSFTPEISFNNIRVITTESEGGLGISKKDSVVMSINFQDGNGDLGITNLELANLKKTKGDSIKTFVVALYVAKNGKFIKSNSNEQFSGNIPIHFKEGTKAGPIEGTIDYSAIFLYNVFAAIPNLTGKNDTVKFELTIKDRALNVSNTIQTSPVVIYTK